MSQKQSQDASCSLMDGVRVKISEKYKPPPRINLAISYSQRISINKQLQDNMPRYDFTLESSIREKMKEWRTARSVVSADRKEKLDKIKSERQRIADENAKIRNDELEKLENMKSEIECNLRQNYTSGGVLIPTQVSSNNYTNILTPIPLSSQSNTAMVIDKSPINISDFEPDTCSPFDNVELKTINDMEELKLVLQNDDKRSNQTNYSTVGAPYDKYPSQDSQLTYYGYNVAHSSHQTYTTINSIYTNGYNFYPPDTALHPNSSYNIYNYNNAAATDYSNSFDAQTPQAAVDNKIPFRSVPDIMKALQTELNNTHLDNKSTLPNHSISNNKAKTSPNENVKDKLENPFEFLPKSSQDVCSQISVMGFPLARVARVCKSVGADKKKILEHLLAMSELLDLGFPEGSVSAALQQCNNDRDKALEILIL